MIYDYSCPSCGAEEAKTMPITQYDPKVVVHCPECSHAMVRVFCPPHHLYSMKGCYGSNYDNEKALRDQQRGKFVKDTI